MEILFGIIGVIAFVFSIYTWYESRLQGEKAERAINAIPNDVVNAVGKILNPSPSNDKEMDKIRINGHPHMLVYEDVDGDGNKELLIEYTAGAHGSCLDILKWDVKEMAHKYFASLSSGTPAGFQVVQDKAGGPPFLRTQETDYSTDLPYVSAPRIQVDYQWNGSEYKVVSREKMPASENLSPEDNKYVVFEKNNPKSFAYLLRYYVCRMKGIQDIFNQYQKRVDDGMKFSSKDVDTYRFLAELSVSMLYEITNVLKTLHPEDYSAMLNETRKKGSVIQLEKLEGLRHSTLHLPDDLKTYLRRQNDFTTYVQNHGEAIGYLDSIIDSYSDALIKHYPDVESEFKSMYYSGTSTNNGNT